jgi:hypothetical protein
MMNISAALEQPQSRPLERRRHQRVKVALLGRYMLDDKREYPCQSVDMSPGGVLVIAAVRGALEERSVIYFEHIGRVEGKIARHTQNGFALAINASIHKRDKIASQLTWLANRFELGLPEDRRHERITPTQSGTILTLPDGRKFSARLIDISLSGAAVSCDARPLIGTAITVGSTPGKVVRYFQDGIGIEFFLQISPDKFDENIDL